MARYLILALVLALGACQKAPEARPDKSPDGASDAQAASEPASAASRLAEILAAQPEAVKARYQYRNPGETLAFFGIEPGMTVVEVLPGGGWYSKILIPYLGPDGHLIGVDYNQSMFPKFGFFSDEFLASKETWVADWTAGASAWFGDEGAQISAFALGEMPGELEGTADAVLMIRATHNLARFESEGGYLSQAVADIHRVLKPGGILGVVQHQAADDAPDAWTDGTRGYLKQDFVIKVFEDAGFRLVASSPLNHNLLDQPGENDVVWRLPPTLATSGEDPDLRAQMNAIGESNRMTLKFVKPAA